MKDYTEIREKWKQLLTGGNELDWEDPDIAAKTESITREAEGYRETMLYVGDREALWEDLKERNSAYVTAAYRRIRTMALAWNLKGSSLYQKEELKKDILDALDWISRYRYNGEFYKDWWDWQIGSPMALNDCVILMYDELSVRQKEIYMERLAGYMGDPGKDVGANRSWKCRVYALYGAIMESSWHLERARDCFLSLCEYVSEDDGMYDDGSFIQHHDHPYNMGYGIDLLSDMADFLYLLESSPWEVSAVRRKNVYDWISLAYEPFLYHGLAMDMVRGREMARSYHQDDDAGRTAMAAIVRLSRTAPERETALYGRILKRELKESNIDQFYHSVSSPELIVQTKRLLQETPGDKEEEDLLCRIFPEMDRAVQRTEGYAVGISMHSSRTANYEADIKEENIKGWHTGDGMMYLYLSDDSQYHEDFWPTVDSFRLPGTTVLSGTAARNDQRGLSAWTGGTVLDTRYGVCGMEYASREYSLRAKKSWFLFEGKIVALGADIRSTDHIPVETIVENRKLDEKESCSLYINGKLHQAEEGRMGRLEKVRYMHLDGKKTGAGIGYYFPEETTLFSIREKREDCWNSINKNPAMSCSPMHRRQYQTVWIDHGRDPSGTEYAYVLLPGAKEAQTRDYARQPDIEILRNDGQVQAVRDNSVKLTGANFWSRTEQSVAGIRCDGCASVLLMETGETLRISVSDPMWGNYRIRLTLAREAEACVSVNERITIRMLSPEIVLEADTKGLRGKGIEAVFRLKRVSKGKRMYKN